MAFCAWISLDVEVLRVNIILSVNLYFRRPAAPLIGDSGARMFWFSLLKMFAFPLCLAHRSPTLRFWLDIWAISVFSLRLLQKWALDETQITNVLQMFKTPRKCLRSFLCSSIIFSDNWQFSEARLSRKLNYVLNKHHFLPPPPSFYYFVRVILYSGLKQIQNEIQFRSVWSSWTAESFHLAVNFHSRLCVFWIVGRVTKCEILTPSLTGYLVKN